ncbi:hypothetical protein CEP54_000457 [Fusarium duplospermum]|uniref:Uncharacterized protein n=1 Tax=Fusarium duplospermum TaxID=1325734 RepID=A0A428R6K3_9HYPO|nr:hypothetical protein CEP54_000457 [Fusarium duplospermum]
MQPAEGPETLALWDGHFWTVPARDMSLGLAGESCSKGNGSGGWVSRAWGVAGGGWVCVGSSHPGPSDALNRLPGILQSRILGSLWPTQMPRCLALLTTPGSGQNSL